MFNVRYVVLLATNMERSIRFYRDIVGLQPIEMSEWWAEFDTGGARLALCPGEAATPKAGGAFVQLSCADLQVAVDALRERGAQVDEPAIEEGMEYPTARLYDPDGALLVLDGEGD